MSIVLRPYQQESIDALRAGIRNKHRCQILCAPTGGGKTFMGGSLIKSAMEKGSRCAFLVDRVALVKQTSRSFYDLGIRHGVIQGDNSFNRDAQVLVCSAQTIEKRGFWPDLDLLIVDEAHTIRQKVVEYIGNTQIPVIGLSATPFSPGLGEIYSNVVNVCTTDELIEGGYLAPLKVYVAKEIDMKGAAMSGGEWTDKAAEERSMAIVGDVVTEWQEKTQEHFGGPAKTIVFSATVDHGAEICREFQAAGFNFQQVSYKTPEDEKERLIEAFRGDSHIDGLVSVEALAKGFDVPDILCMIDARPLRRSLSTHIQKIGRAMRSHPGKDFALLLDHSGNYVGFYNQMLEFFANGVTELSSDDRDKQIRNEPESEEAKEIKCSCGFVLAPSMVSCPACGKERRRKSTVEQVAGEMVEMDGSKKKPAKPYLESKREAWDGICRVALDRKRGDEESAKRFARAQYKNFFDTWPPFPFTPAATADPRLASHIKANVIKYAKSRKRSAA